MGPPPAPCAPREGGGPGPRSPARGGEPLKILKRNHRAARHPKPEPERGRESTRRRTRRGRRGLCRGRHRERWASVCSLSCPGSVPGPQAAWPDPTPGPTPTPSRPTAELWRVPPLADGAKALEQPKSLLQFVQFQGRTSSRLEHLQCSGLGVSPLSVVSCLAMGEDAQGAEAAGSAPGGGGQLQPPAGGAAARGEGPGPGPLAGPHPPLPHRWVTHPPGMPPRRGREWGG